MTNRISPTWLSLVSAIASGLLLAASYGLHPWWPAAWVAPIPLLIASYSVGAKASFGLGALAGAVASSSLLGYMFKLAGPIDALSISVLRAAQWALVVALWRLAANRAPMVVTVFVVPALLAGFEVVTTLASPHGSGGSLAYSQMDFLPAIQVASLGGTAAVVFVPMLAASAVAVAVVRKAWPALLPAALIIGLALGFGSWRLAKPEALEGPMVALISSDHFKRTPEDWRAVWSHYSPAIVAASQQGAQLVVLPEKLFRLPAAEADAFRAEAEGLVNELGLDLLLGVDDRSGDPRNRAFLFSPTLGMRTYDKQHHIPGIESHFTPGEQRLEISKAGTGLGVLICKDMDFPDTLREYKDSSVFLVPAWDFGEDAWFHSRMAILRGVENGASVLRAAREGFLTVSDSRGRVLEEANSTPKPTTLLVQLPSHPKEPTLYAAVGDVFGWSCLAFALGMVGYLVVVKRPQKT